MIDQAAATRLRVYTGGFLLKPALRRILELAGWEVGTGVPQEGDWVGIWGRTATAWRGEAVAGWADAPILTVEDAPLRSVHPARVRDSLPHGLCLDRTGVHFDGTAPSDLETLLATHPLDDTHLLNRARDAIDGLKYWHLGKYAATDPNIEPPDPGYVLVIDQTEGDAALKGADQAAFREMLTTAATENPASRVLVKRHPETVGGARKGLLDDLRGVDRAEVYDQPISPWTLLEGAVGVYTHSSTIGFEAIFAGHKPRVFGQPFYAGWGLTLDEADLPRRRRTLSRAQLFAGAMMLYPTWYDPVLDRLCEIEDVIAAFAAETRAWREDRGGYVMGGMRRWKRPALKRAFGKEGALRFASTGAAAAKAATGERRPVVWGDAEAPAGTFRMEDGFLRSEGLGAALTPPVSLVLDDLGIYFDPRSESRLDRLIAASTTLPDGELRRAERLRQKICKLGATKYGGATPAPEVGSNGLSKILVVGQVEDDASIRLGATDISTNLDLLKRARSARPDAMILWKPHPDVEAGFRAGAVDNAALEGLADLALTGTGADAAIGLADEVWTITSTLGFEALLRDVPVTVLGQPFYAGWGLTQDHVAQPGHRKADGITIDGLTHACLIGYPRYFHPGTGAPLSAEQAIDLLTSDGFELPTGGLLGWLQRVFNRA